MSDRGKKLVTEDPVVLMHLAAALVETLLKCIFHDFPLTARKIAPGQGPASFDSLSSTDQSMNIRSNSLESMFGETNKAVRQPIVTMLWLNLLQQR